MAEMYLAALNSSEEGKLAGTVMVHTAEYLENKFDLTSKGLILMKYRFPIQVSVNDFLAMLADGALLIKKSH